MYEKRIVLTLYDDRLYSLFAPLFEYFKQIIGRLLQFAVLDVGLPKLVGSEDYQLRWEMLSFSL